MEASTVTAIGALVLALLNILTMFLIAYPRAAKTKPGVATTIDTKDLMRRIEITVMLKNYGVWKARLKIAEWLIRLGFWIAWCGKAEVIDGSEETKRDE